MAAIIVVTVLLALALERIADKLCGVDPHDRVVRDWEAHIEAEQRTLAADAQRRLARARALWSRLG